MAVSAAAGCQEWEPGLRDDPPLTKGSLWVCARLGGFCAGLCPPAAQGAHAWGQHGGLVGAQGPVCPPSTPAVPQQVQGPHKPPQMKNI